MTADSQARAVADAVLYEGFLLYPYTGSAPKNRMRWQFGVVMPQGFADESEPSQIESQLLMRPDSGDAALEAALRFLQPAEPPCEREVEVTFHLRDGAICTSFAFEALHGTLAIEAVRDGPYARISVRVENHARVGRSSTRDAALPFAFAGTHIVLRAAAGCFVSLLDPPHEARDAAARCTNRRLFPVLAGDEEEGATASAVALASPIILYDFPRVASKSAGQTFDNLEIDELLLLSVASLTEEEKAEARAGDPRARAIVDRADAMNAQVQGGLHAGMQVRVHPRRRADAFDMFAEGKTARVQALHEDVDGRRYVSVVFDDDPAADLHQWYGRSFFYESDEVEPA